MQRTKTWHGDAISVTEFELTEAARQGLMLPPSLPVLDLPRPSWWLRLLRWLRSLV